MKKDEVNLRSAPEDCGSSEDMRNNSFRCIIDSIQDIFESYASLDDPMVEPDDYFGLTVDALKESLLEDEKDSQGTATPPPVEEQHDGGITIVPIESFPFEEDVLAALADTPPVYTEPSGLSSTISSNTKIKTPKAKKPSSPKPTAPSPPAEDSKPKRPLSAYNLFFQLERERLIAGVDPDAPFTAEDVERVAINRRLMEQGEKPKRKHRKSHGKISFAELARKIANKWKVLDPDAKDLLRERAAIEKARYLRELETWTTNNNASQRAEFVKKLATSNSEMVAPSSPARTADMEGSFHMITPDQYHHQTMHQFASPNHGGNWQNPRMMPSQMSPQASHQQNYGNYHHATITPPFSSNNSFESVDNAYNNGGQEMSSVEYEAYAMAERTGWNPSAIMHMMQELDSQQQGGQVLRNSNNNTNSYMSSPPSFPQYVSQRESPPPLTTALMASRMHQQQAVADGTGGEW